MWIERPPTDCAVWADRERHANGSIFALSRGQSVPVFRPLILPLVLLLSTAPTAQAMCRADCVGTVPRGRAAGACHDAAGAAMTATLPKDCLRSGLASVPLAVVLDGSSTPQAPQILPVGAPALVVAFDAPLKAQSTAIPKALDGRRVETPLRI